MRQFFMSLAFVLVAATAGSATETTPAAPRVEVVPSVVTSTQPAGEAAMRLDRVRVEERASSDDAAAAQLPARGSFWWLVGVVVVAGVILAVIL